MSAPNDGGPAFPAEDDDMNFTTGMTLRDYFAAKAMAAIITAEWDYNYMRITNQSAAREAVNFADALIAELAKGAA